MNASCKADVVSLKSEVDSLADDGILPSGEENDAAVVAVVTMSGGVEETSHEDGENTLTLDQGEFLGLDHAPVEERNDTLTAGLSTVISRSPLLPARVMSRINTRTWLDPQVAEQELFLRVLTSVAVLAPKTWCMPRTTKEWIEHRAAVLEDDARKSWHRIKALAELSSSIPQVRGLQGTTLSKGRALCLSWPTIWCQHPSVVDRPDVLWPGLDEMRWEGDSRARRDLGRFLPMLRIPGNGTVIWYRRPARPMYEFDRVWKVPTAEDICWAQVVNEDMHESLLGEEFWNAINDSVFI